jgi:hypothetical protein
MQWELLLGFYLTIEEKEHQFRTRIRIFKMALTLEAVSNCNIIETANMNQERGRQARGPTLLYSHPVSCRVVVAAV